MPRMRWRVVCARGVTMESGASISAFSSVDLPTFGRPTIATLPQRNESLTENSVSSKPTTLAIIHRRLRGQYKKHWTWIDADKARCRLIRVHPLLFGTDTVGPVMALRMRR